MKTKKKKIVLFILICATGGVLSNSIGLKNFCFFIGLPFCGLLIFNLFVRNIILFKAYFLSKYNIFTDKIKSNKTYDIPVDILFEKIIEVLDDSEFDLVNVNRTEYKILANTKLKINSGWPENIYLDFKSKGEQTILNFYSVSIFGIQSFWEQENNLDKFLIDFENSLTI